MRDAFHRELEELRRLVLDMAALARGMLMDGTSAFVRLERDVATSVQSRKDALAKMDEAIEDKALRLVALQQPMARDLRAIGAALKMNTYLNRIGRYGKDIAQLAERWEGHPNPDFAGRVSAVADRVGDMLDLALDAYRREGPVDLERLLRSEEEVDRARWDMFEASMAWMTQVPANVEPGAHYMMVARYLERAADNACKIAEKVHFMATGQRVEIR